MVIELRTSCVRFVLWVVLLTLAWGCRGETAPVDTLFTRLDARHTGITFANTVRDRPEFNILDYLYFYDGGGVAIGDVTNDGLDDIFFTGNQVANRLYLNRGTMRFEDVTELAGMGDPEPSGSTVESSSAGSSIEGHALTGESHAWSTGVTMADVNADGWLDIYVCQVSYGPAGGRNLLYINNGDGTFAERAAEFGLDFEGLSTQAAFFDYDRDGDLDAYLLNHAIHTRESFVSAWRRSIDAPEGDRLYRNDDGRFVDVTNESGIYSSVLGYGLGVAVSDFNQDGWPDIYVGNDFHENDYLYFNNGDGTFSEGLQHVIGHTSQSSMGNDVADMNNDGRVDVVSLDMLPPDVPTYRKSGGPDDDELARIKRDFGYGPQYARNTLQLNRGLDERRLPIFSEIGTYAGVHATDWSWAALFADLDNDGWKDLYITNGILRRPNDLDYVAHISQPDVQRVLNTGSPAEQLDAAALMPAVEIANYAFANNGDLTFTDRAGDWGLGDPGFSNGAAYGDLDNDGDLDLVVNNINGPASVYQNNLSTGVSVSRRVGRGLTVVLKGDGDNTTGIGAKVWAYADKSRIYQEQMPTRGFQSSVSHRLHIGLGEVETTDSLRIVWPDGRTQRLDEVPSDTSITLYQADARDNYDFDRSSMSAQFFRDVSATSTIDFVHRENDYDDFKHQPLAPHRTSTEGPAFAVGDVDGDGLGDLFLGGAHGQTGRLFIQQRDGSWRASLLGDEHLHHEDVDAAFFDADGDGDQDLYVVSGGGQHDSPPDILADRLYLNDGGGAFVVAGGRLPDVQSDGCCVVPSDYDGDGDVDLFVGSRSVPGSYGASPSSHILENTNGHFSDVTATRAPALEDIGMVTDAEWSDVDGDGRADLVLVGEWMPVTVLRNVGSHFEDATAALGLASTGGWWNAVLVADLDRDGDADIVGGNLGSNSVFGSVAPSNAGTRISAGAAAPAGTEATHATSTADGGSVASIADAGSAAGDTVIAIAATVSTGHSDTDGAMTSELLDLYVHDFDDDGTPDPMLIERRSGRPYGWARRDELLAQMPALRVQIPTYASYAELTADELLGSQAIAVAKRKVVHTLRSAVFENRGAEGFHRRDLPEEAQFAPVMDLLADDFDRDGFIDVLAAGNFFGADTKQGRYDAGHGLLLRGNGSGDFEYVEPASSGIVLRGEARKIHMLEGEDGSKRFVIARNDDRVIVLKWHGGVPLESR